MYTYVTFPAGFLFLSQINTGGKLSSIPQKREREKEQIYFWAGTKHRGQKGLCLLIVFDFLLLLQKVCLYLSISLHFWQKRKMNSQDQNSLFQSKTVKVVDTSKPLAEVTASKASAFMKLDKIDRYRHLGNGSPSKPPRINIWHHRSTQAELSIFFPIRSPFSPGRQQRCLPLVRIGVFEDTTDGPVDQVVHPSRSLQCSGSILGFIITSLRSKFTEGFSQKILEIKEEQSPKRCANHGRAKYTADSSFSAKVSTNLPSQVSLYPSIRLNRSSKIHIFDDGWCAVWCWWSRR